MKLTDKRFWIFEAFVAFVSVGVGYSMLYMEWDTYYTIILPDFQTDTIMAV